MKRKMAALVIGNASYPDRNELKNPVNDALDMGAKLKSYEFEVVVATDCSHKAMDRALKDFRQLLDTHDIGLFFFAGHGMQIEGQNYLLATDTDFDTENDAKHSSLALDRVLDVMEKSKATTKIVILDACRNNPWERRWHRSAATRGLASVYAPKGTIIGFATSPGEVALDGTGRNGTYTEALLQHIDTPDSSIETMFKRVRNTVAAATRGKQTSWEHTSLSGEFYFNLSLGKLIEDYDPTAIKDSLFIIDEARKSHQIIKGLKTYTYGYQNEALGMLNASSVAKMATNNLFVLGRNIYQAACGGSNSAVDLVEKFMLRTQGFPAEKRKALLDGMLFEIFFDSKAELRALIKDRFFDEVFDLQQHATLKDSFDFIAKALTAARAEFYALPGKGHELSVTVNTQEDDGDLLVESIYIDGANVLRNDGDDWLSFDAEGNPELQSITAAKLAEQLSKELVIPRRLLHVKYTPKGAPDGRRLKIAQAWTVRKE